MTMRRLQRGTATVLLLVVLCLIVASAASADRIYWGNSSNTISFAALDGSESGSIDVGGAPIANPRGLAIDSTDQRIYWANNGGDSLGSASISGGGGLRFETGELATVRPVGAAVDPIAGRLYWIDSPAEKIVFGKLDGSFSAFLPTTGATVNRPSSLVIDRTAGRIYWTNGIGQKPISFANLDGSGGGDLNTAGALAPFPQGIAIDRAHGRLYWANLVTPTIGFARLDGSGGGNLPTGAATAQTPAGIAIDPLGGRLYWANSGGTKLSFANLDGSGGGDLALPGPAPINPSFPVLQVSPRPSAPPVVGGGTRPGSLLTCSDGEWAPDLLEAYLYRAPQTFSYQWTQNGLDIPGATAKTLSVSAVGDYGCRVSARNRAGVAAQGSRTHAVRAAAFGPRTGVTLALASPRATRGGRVAVRVVNANPFAVSGRVSLLPKRPAGKPRAKPFATAPLKVEEGSKTVLKLQLPVSARKGLAARRALRLVLEAAVSDLEGNVRRLAKPTVVRPSRG
jgi:DNA-binding beta-propeller fold protein YncE